MVPRSARPTSWGCRPRWPCSPTSSCAKGSRRGPGTSGCTTYGAGRSSPAVVISPRLRSPTCWPATSPGSSPTCGRPRDHSLPPAPLAGRPVALASSGEALDLPVVHIAYPFPAGLGRWADPRVTGNTALTQGEHVRPILVDPRRSHLGAESLAPNPQRRIPSAITERSRAPERGLPGCDRLLVAAGQSTMSKGEQPGGAHQPRTRQAGQRLVAAPPPYLGVGTRTG